MVIINIAELEEFTHESLYEHLQSQHTYAFRIIVPFLHEPDEEDLFMWYQDYYYGFYIMEQLNSVSRYLSYTIPAVFSKHPFSFNVYTASLRQLTAVLMQAGAYYSNFDDNDLMEEFIDQAIVFWDKVGKREVQPVCLPYMRYFNILCSALQ